MDSKTIRQILDKYWEGETSLKEEAMLRTFFNQDDVPEEFEAIQPMFQFFKQEQEAYLNGDFDERLSSKLQSVDNQRPRRHSLPFYIKRIAAVAAILIGVFFFINKTGFKLLDDDIAYHEISAEEKEEAKVAYAEAKAALMMISTKLNKGANKADEGIVKVRRATKVIK